LDLLTKQLLARLTRLWGWNNLNTFFKTISRYLEIVVEKSIRGCQIFRGTKKYWVKSGQTISLPKCPKISQMAMKCTKIF
jgi:hypothetical protein